MSNNQQPLKAEKKLESLEYWKSQLLFDKFGHRFQEKTNFGGETKKYTAENGENDKCFQCTVLRQQNMHSSKTPLSIAQRNAYTADIKLKIRNIDHFSHFPLRIFFSYLGLFYIFCENRYHLTLLIFDISHLNYGQCLVYLRVGISSHICFKLNKYFVKHL
jgi:hypothetical protein